MKKLYYILFLGCMLAAACTNADYELQNLVPENFHKIVYFKDASGQKVTKSFTNDKVSYKDSLVVIKAGSDPSLTVNVTFELMSQEEVNTNYSIPEGIDYKILSSDAYQFAETAMQLGTGETSKNFYFTVNPQEIFVEQKQNPGAKLVLPILMKSETDSVNVNKNLCLFVYDVTSSSFITFASDEVERANMVYKSLDIKVKANFRSTASNLSFSCPLKQASDAEALVKEYNDAHGSSYTLLPDGSVTDFGAFNFESGVNESEATLTINREQLVSDEVYILPVQLEGTEEIEGKVDIEEKVKYIVISNPKYGITEVTPEEKKEKFRILFCNSDNALAPGATSDNSGVKAIIDNDWNTYWHSNWGDKPMWEFGGWDDVYCENITDYHAFKGQVDNPVVIIDLGKKRKVSEIGLLSRYTENLNYKWMDKVVIQGSTDDKFKFKSGDLDNIYDGTKSNENSWILLIDKDGLPQVNDEPVWLEMENNYKEVRLICLQFKNDSSRNAALAEFLIKEVITIDGESVNE